MEGTNCRRLPPAVDWIESAASSGWSKLIAPLPNQQIEALSTVGRADPCGASAVLSMSALGG
jgi:hypothetical protein